MRKKRPLQRSTGVVRDATLIVIASEDRYAVKQYFEVFRSSRIQFQVLETEDTRSSPAQVMARLEKYQQDFDFGEGDQFWLVCDIDHWNDAGHIQNLVDVIRRCRQKGINVALSNPCFEYWLLLHFQDPPNGNSEKSQQVIGRLKVAAGGYNKTKVYRLPITHSNVLKAVERAKTQHSSDCIIPSKNQTAVFQIIDALLAKNIIAVSS